MTSRLRTHLGCAALLFAFAFGTAGVASAQSSVSLTMSGCVSLSGPVITGNTISVTCNGSGGGGPTPPSCTLPSLTPVGGTLTFSSTCTQGTNPITSVTAAGAVQTGPFTSGRTYTVTGITTPTTPPGQTFTITASDGTLTGGNSVFYPVSGGGGGAVDLTACTTLGYPLSGYYDSNYPSGSNINITNIFHAATPTGRPFGNSSALVVRFQTPALGVNDQTNPNFQAWASGSNNNHQATIGTAPCLVPTSNSSLPADWAHASGAGVLKTVLSQTPSFTAVVTADGLCNLGAACANSSTVWLRPNTTYYITLVNKSASWTGTPNCSTGDCDMRWNFNN